ncbi:MAG: V-type ATP synthase subunit D [Bacillota bacterium]|nr:V-type ATP synthase subunit D [Bacillota bacterium]
MNVNVFPTKGNLMNIKRSFSLAKLGYELLDKKRNVMIMEMMALMGKAKEIQAEIDSTFADAYFALSQANITMGVDTIYDISLSYPVDDTVNVKYRSVMGTALPIIAKPDLTPKPFYGFEYTNSRFDKAFISFLRVKELILRLAEIENSIYRLAYNVKKTQKRANALHDIIIPQYSDIVKFITEALEEKDREEFSRLKIIKSIKTGNNKREK